MSNIIVVGHIVQLLMQHKVGATPVLGLHFREVRAELRVHIHVVVYACNLYTQWQDDERRAAATLSEAWIELNERRHMYRAGSGLYF